MYKRLLCTLFAAILLLCAPARAEEALLYNADFSSISAQQSLPAGWYFEAWEETASAGYAVSDTSGNIVLIENNEENDARVCQRVTVEPSTCYRITCEISAIGVTGGAGAYISVMDTFAGSQPVFETDGFQTVTLTGVTAGDQTQIVLALRLGGYGALSTGTAKYRNIQMEKLDGTPLGAQSFELVTQVYDADPLTPPGLEAEAITPAWVGILLVFALCAVGFSLFYRFRIRRAQPAMQRKDGVSIALILFAAFLLRMLLSLVFVGHYTDIGCFQGWAGRMAETGPAGFYGADYFADYPPGYMYVLWAIGVAKELWGLSFNHPLFILLLKLPSFAAEFLSAWFIYRLALKHQLSARAAWSLFVLLLFHPVFAFVSGGWGQIDSLLTLCLTGVLYLFASERRILAGGLFGLAILLKPQALMLGPLLAFAYLLPQNGKRYLLILRDALLAVGMAVGLIAALALPFSPGQEADWLWEKYFSTVTSYDYASVEAFNLYALFGGNWKQIDGIFFLFSYQTWGLAGIAASVAGSALIYARALKKSTMSVMEEGRDGPVMVAKSSAYDLMTALCLSSAFLFIALFTLGPYMHERYLYPALLPLLIAAIRTNDKRLYASFLWFSATLMLNAVCAFYIIDHQYARGEVYDLITRAGSLMTVAGFFHLCVTLFMLLWKGRGKPSSMTEHSTHTAPSCIKKLFRRKDHYFCWGLTLVYSLFALTNLGSLHAPETEYHSDRVGEEVVVVFDEVKQISEIWMFPGIGEGSLLVKGGGEASLEQSYSNMFRWSRSGAALNTDSVTIMTYSGALSVREITFISDTGEALIPKEVSVNGAALFDEQDTVPIRPSYYNGMYFDELYHARTAYEHLNGIYPYEISHPPLGKILIMAGVALFGMNPFGWRIIGTLFGIAMVPILYAFAKRMFKRSEFALLCGALFVFDFMHFTQTRIATIDVYAVFFIILMYDYMYRYYSMSFFEEGFGATLKPLGLAGLFFGLGAASKWICVYAGLGLAVLLFTSLGRRYIEYREALRSDDALMKEKVRPFPVYLIKTLLWCLVFFVAVPVVIYLLSYTPHYLLETGYGFREVWENQAYMLNYHGGLTATHPFQSAWYEWPFTLRPMWYYSSDSVPASWISTLTASGNPAVWWIATVGTMVFMLDRMYLRIMRPELCVNRPSITVVFIGVAANFLPWVLITRCTFIYHFFATTPFIILAAVMLLYHLEREDPRLKWVKWAWIGLAALLFLLMYPGISGLEVPISYARAMRYIPGGTVFYGA